MTATQSRVNLQDLCLEEHSFVNDFGSQLEVSAHSSFSKNQKSVRDSERLVCQQFTAMQAHVCHCCQKQNQSKSLRRLA